MEHERILSPDSPLDELFYIPTDLPRHTIGIARILSRFRAGDLAAFVTVAIDLLDVASGDPESEPNGDDEANGDERDAAYVEWHSMSGSQKHGPNIASDNEDDEESDPPEDDDPFEDDGCDKAVDDDPCDQDTAEIEQMTS
jgi:hypothetical protein